jgi:hypothetical protein
MVGGDRANSAGAELKGIVQGPRACEARVSRNGWIHQGAPLQRAPSSLVISTRAPGPWGEVVVGEPRKVENSLCAAVSMDGHNYDIHFQCDDLSTTACADPFLAAALIPAMRGGTSLQVRGPVSPLLLSAVTRIADVLHVWNPNFRRIPVDAPTKRSRRHGPDGGVASFFSGGVDSSYSALRHLDEITALIFVHWADPRPRRMKQRTRGVERVREAARDLGKPLIEVRTNLRVFADVHVSWEEYFHGAALASVALAVLSPRFSKVYIPSTLSYAKLIPWGSHPLLDPLWSVEETALVHDGCEATRGEKIAYLAERESPLGWLRVCPANTDTAYNCGRCGKCLRTMIGLRLAGALERCPTLPSELDLKEVARLRVKDGAVRAILEEFLFMAELGGADLAVARALRRCLARDRLRSAIKLPLLRRFSFAYDRLPAGPRGRLAAARTRWRRAQARMRDQRVH